MSQTQRNDPCPCGSGKKYKKCCMNKGAEGLLTKGFSSKISRVSVALVIIFVISIFLRYYGFHQPHGFTFDEGLYAELLAVQLKEDSSNYSTQEAYRVQTADGKKLPAYLDRPLFKHPPLYSYLIALNYTIFGASHLAAVSVSVLFGSFMVLVVFLLGKELYDHRVGFLAALFLCLDPVHWICSERIWMETTMSFFMLLAVYLFVLGQKRSVYLSLSGLSIGLAMLTKYPGILPLFIIMAYVVFIERPMLKQKGFWLLCFLSVLVFLPWVIWNWKVYGNLNDALVSAHALQYHWNSTMNILTEYKGFLFVFGLFAGLLFFLRRKIRSFFSSGSTEPATPQKERLAGIVCLLVFAGMVAAVPLLRETVKGAFIWKDNILVGWSNPFKNGPWHFYLTRLSELSPLYLFSFLSVFFVFGKNKGDRLLLLSSSLILGAFILLGNYQSRYVLSAVPFLLILSARCQVWIYDKISSGIFAKTILAGIVFYFTLQTLRTDWLIAIGPDFGYF